LPLRRLNSGRPVLNHFHAVVDDLLFAHAGATGQRQSAPRSGILQLPIFKFIFVPLIRCRDLLSCVRIWQNRSRPNHSA
jgi:hypothetical protein